MKRKQVTFANPPTDARYEAQHARLERLQGSVHDGEMTPSEPPEVRRRPSAYVPAAPEAKPIVRSIPQVVDPYASNMPETIQIVAHHKSDDTGRTKALIRKAREITLVVGLLTGAVMYAFTLYPQTWGGFAIFVLWCTFALTEWLAAFIILAILDYKETPAAQNRYQMKNMMRMAWREQTHRLRSMYPDQEIEG